MKKIALLLCLLAFPSLAHDDAEWIMQNPNYLDKNERHCCGPRDCQVMPSGFLQRVEGGWLVKGVLFLDGTRGLYQSQDEKVWWCVGVYDYEEIGKPKCLFVPDAQG